MSFLVPKDFANIKAIGNPNKTMQTIIILVIAIAKFDPMLVKEPLHLTYSYARKEYTCVAQDSLTT
ncbi:MAG: hypothetical protein WBL68_12080 [Nitrososphaeraceae archaeon]